MFFFLNCEINHKTPVYLANKKEYFMEMDHMCKVFYALVHTNKSSQFTMQQNKQGLGFCAQQKGNLETQLKLS